MEKIQCRELLVFSWRFERDSCGDSEHARPFSNDESGVESLRSQVASANSLA
jgi:hypothetical protein